MRPTAWIAVLAVTVWGSAAAQPQPSASASVASAPANGTAPVAKARKGKAKSTAPTNPTTSTLQDARLPADDGGGSQATPQIAIPLGRTAEKPVALKPGKAQGAKGGIDDSTARCLAQTASGAAAKCATP
ncbi:MAG TPA: hypothetical protein VFL64_21505 [Rhizobacter sp.]|nr:hypothetical protein [Rhizobacter sp.]